MIATEHRWRGTEERLAFTVGATKLAVLAFSALWHHCRAADLNHKLKTNRHRSQFDISFPFGM
jgi:hypothetical protein